MAHELFMPAVFTAHDGGVFFEGRCIPQLRCIAVREHLNRVALDHTQSQRAADAHWAIATQLRKAMTEARHQRESGKHLRIVAPTQAA